MKGQNGFSFIETVIAIGLLGILAAGYLGALSTNIRVLIYTDEQQTAKTLAEHQLEYIKDQTYASSYTAEDVSDDYPGYTVSVTAIDVASRDYNLQKITITVSHKSKPVIMVDGSTLQGYKVNR